MDLKEMKAKQDARHLSQIASEAKLHANWKRIEEYRKKMMHEFIDKAPEYYLEYIEKVIYRHYGMLLRFEGNKEKGDELTTLMMNTINCVVQEEKKANLF